MATEFSDDDQLVLLRKANAALRRDLERTRNRAEVLKFERDNMRVALEELLEFTRRAHRGQVSALTIRACVDRGLTLRATVARDGEAK